ncbi:MAG: alanine--tRNA ligase [Candidatus Lariskella arthropodorum]
MSDMKLSDIRKNFLEFFSNCGHEIVESNSLIPTQDPTLMFTNSGMVQFKNYFTGVQVPTFKRAATAQKCVRAGGKHNDLDNVGYTARHHTFFEMLGNFSFGDYFKAEAIEFAWRYITSEIGLNKEKLYITVYHDDEEAFGIWKALTGFADDRIIRIATSDNFWSMGELGPCGPCSEIFYDHGDKYFGGLPGTKDADGDRYIEIWNLVFMQYEQCEGGIRKNLPKPSIDTGMGLERIAAVLQGKNDNYDIDLFQSLIGAVKSLAGDVPTNASHKVIADHLRASCFLIASGLTPSNEGRGYVLRRIMRRAMRHVHSLGYMDAMMYRLVPALIGEMGDAYPELKRGEHFIMSTLKEEEERFSETLERGLRLLNASTDKIAQGGVMDGEVAFKLYDTYGFPLDLTKDFLRARGIMLDEAGFESCMQEQKERAKAAWVGSGSKADDLLWYQIYDEFGATEFIGYLDKEAIGKVVAIVQEGRLVTEAAAGEAIVIVNQTPFYAESGGQVGDTGVLSGHKVSNTQKYADKLFGHHVTLQANISPIRVDEQVNLVIDDERRSKIRANHSATHLLHLALREILGAHVVQKGSIVTDIKLRFDFAHNKALSLDEIKKIEERVNSIIIANIASCTEIMPQEAAIERGAVALFGDKYDDKVRVVQMGDSMELCGGTHVSRTGDIGFFKIASDSSIASCVRRIEALTGMIALEYVSDKLKVLNALSSIMKCQEQDLPEKLELLTSAKRSLEKELQDLKLKNLANTNLNEEVINSSRCYIAYISDIAPKDVRSVASIIKNRIKDGVLIVISKDGNIGNIFLQICNTPKFAANEILKKMSEYEDLRGGGNKEFAQASFSGISDGELLEILRKVL